MGGATAAASCSTFAVGRGSTRACRQLKCNTAAARIVEKGHSHTHCGAVAAQAGPLHISNGQQAAGSRAYGGVDGVGGTEGHLSSLWDRLLPLHSTANEMSCPHGRSGRIGQSFDAALLPGPVCNHWQGLRGRRRGRRRRRAPAARHTGPRRTPSGVLEPCEAQCQADRRVCGALHARQEESNARPRRGRRDQGVLPAAINWERLRKAPADRSSHPTGSPAWQTCAACVQPALGTRPVPTARFAPISNPHSANCCI